MLSALVSAPVMLTPIPALRWLWGPHYMVLGWWGWAGGSGLQPGTRNCRLSPELRPQQTPVQLTCRDAHASTGREASPGRRSG